MCGITGCVALQPFREYCAPSLAQAMAKYLTHRGPDASSVWLVAEGCRARQSWGHAARLLAQSSFSLEAVVDRWFALYTSLIEPMVS